MTTTWILAVFDQKVQSTPTPSIILDCLFVYFSALSLSLSSLSFLRIAAVLELSR